MIPIVEVISTPQLRWELFNKITKHLYGKSSLGILDELKIEKTSPAAIIAAMMAGDPKHPDVLRSMREKAHNYLRQVSISCIALVDTPTYLEISSQYTFDIVASRGFVHDTHILLVSGNLAIWKDAIISGCQREQDYELRIFFNKCLTEFEKLKLQFLWAYYTRTSLQDTSFWLKK